VEAPLTILHVEDDPHDRELAEATLRADGLLCQIRTVASRAALEAALLSDAYDVILADYSLPGFDGLTAQSIAGRLAPQTPFIFLSATLGEELAVERLKEGATDYVLKQRIARLPAAVRRARREAAERAERQRIEDEVRRLNTELETRVAQRTAELAATNEALARREQQLRESDRLLRAILDNSPVAITVKDLEGKYLLVNPRAEAFLGKSRDEVVGLTPHEVLPPRIADVYRTNDRQVIQEKRAAHFEEAVVRPDGLGVLASTRFPLLDGRGEPYAVCNITADITERKKQDDEIKLARLEAQRANLAKSEFLSRMSHDLRTPLNAILGFAQLLELEDLGADRLENVRQILSGGRHLLDLINEVLDITRIETGHLSLSLEAVSVREMVDRTVNLVKPLAVQRGITLEIGPLPPGEPAVLADRQRLGQILINLLSNAVKYNHANGRVTVACEPGSPDAPTPSRITVTDTGAGIPPEKLKLLFQPFERLGAEQTGIEGTGLGLALSRALAQAMGGTLGVETATDRGSTFWVELPTATAPPASAGDQTTLATMAVSPCTGTIVYVEDNAANVQLMERILRRRPGLSLVHVAHGSTALAVVRERRPAIVLLDLHLPDVSGEEVLRQLWADPETRSIPAVFVTADATPGLVRRLQAAGAAACLTKPLEIPAVLRLVDDLVSAHAEGETHVRA
jgi:PAS domain S-box-containing protein